MKKTLLNVLLIIMLSNFLVSIAYSTTPVVDISAIDKLVTQIGLLNDQIKLLEKEAGYLQQQLETLSNGQYRWSNTERLINQLGNIISETNGLSYNAANLDRKFKEYYPGYKSSENFQRQYQTNLNNSLNTINGVLLELGISAKDFMNENARLKFLQKQTQYATGQTQAIQASAQIASESVSQLQLLRQTVMAQTNAQMMYYSTELQKEASSEAEFREILSRGSTKVSAYGSSGYSLSIPAF